MAFYGRTYTLGSADNHGLHAPVKKWDTNGGLPGKFTNESGFLSYFEFCQEEETWTKEHDKIGQCPYAYKKNQWVGYENADSLKIKMDWMKSNKYGGAMIWALDLDDYRGVCGDKDILFNTLFANLESYKVRIPAANELTTTKKPNEWWSPPTTPSTTVSSTTSMTTRTSTKPPTTTAQSTTSRPRTSSTRYTEPTTTRTTSAVATSSSHRPTPRPAEGQESSECSPDSTGQLLASFRPHPIDSTLYLWCINGKELTLSCPPGTAWNNADKQCVARLNREQPNPAKPSAGLYNVDDEAAYLDQTVNLFESSRIPPLSMEANANEEVVFVPRRHATMQFYGLNENDLAFHTRPLENFY